MTHYERIRSELLEMIAKMKPGDRFPNEISLAEHFAVSRMTVNKVITEFAREGRLVRVRRRGSFVMKQTVPREVITFLLPCSNNFSLRIACNLQKQIAGMAEEARRQEARLELVPVTQDNDPDHIDFSLLDHLKADSRVIVESDWYRKSFAFLAERRCRVLLIDRQTLPEGIERFQLLDCDIRGMVRSAVRRLYDRGCRKIAFRGGASRFNSITYRFYRKELDALGLTGLPLFCRPMQPISLNEEELMTLQKFRPDAILFDALNSVSLTGRTFQDVVRIPKELPCEVIRFSPGLNYLEHNPSYSQIENDTIGREAVRMIMNPERPKYRLLPAEYYSAEGSSASGPDEKYSLFA